MKKILLMLFVFASTSAFTQNSWQKAHSNEGNCSISFPAPPTILSNPQTRGDVYTLVNETSILMFTTENFTGRLKNYSNSNVHTDSYLNSLDGFFASYNGKLISHKHSFYNGRRALDFYLTIDIPGLNFNYAKGRYLIENNIIYLVINFYSNFNQTEYNKFLNSLEFY